MTTERDFDRIARAWLELMPDEVPARAIDAVLLAVETTPQVRSPWRWLPWRPTPMNRIPLALGAAAVVAVAGALVFSRSGPGDVGSTPSPSPTIAASPSGSATAGGSLPLELRRIWMGGHRGLVLPGAGSLLDFTTGFHLSQSAANAAQRLESTASPVGDGKLRLESKAVADGCNKGDVGTYSWSLNPSGRILTITEDQDACPTRAGAVVGTWWLRDCPLSDDNCLGAVDAGTYKSQFITPRVDPGGTWNPLFGAVTYTVPDGWANAADWPESFDLAPVSELPPADRSRWITLTTQPSAMSQAKPCSDGVQLGVTRTVDALTTWLRTVPGLVTTEPTGIILDGHPAQMLDIRMDPTWTKKCDDGTGPIVTYMMPGTAVMGTERDRLILVDLGDGDVLQILIWTKDQASFDAFVQEAMPVIQSFRFG